jgi:uncharacterized protein YjdB
MKKFLPISLSTTDLVMKIGETTNLKISHSPSGADEPTYKYYVTNGNVASVNKSSSNSEIVVKALSEGETRLIIETVGLTDASGAPFVTGCNITVNPVEANSVKLDNTELTMEIDKMNILTCTLDPANTTDQKIVWSSSDTTIASVVSKGLSAEVTALSAGNSTIIASWKNANSNIKATCKVVVNPLKVEKIAFTEATKTVCEEDTTHLSLIFTPAKSTNKKVTWSSSNNSIATVDQNGIIKGIKVGECNITAVSTDGGFRATCKIVVTPITVKNVSLNVTKSKLLIDYDKQLQLKATIYPSNAANKSIVWKSSNTSIATVSGSGLVKVIAKGNVIITATSVDGNHSATCEISIVELTDMLNFYLSSSIQAVISGSYFGTFQASLMNNSPVDIKVSKIYVLDSNSRQITTQLNCDLIIQAHQTISFPSMRLNSVYQPWILCTVEYNGKSYTILYRMAG